jgi:pSer/pThr/pTyr-binding forkhead associated (FHA) protein
MKLSLIVQNEGKQFGKVLDINLAQFVIGRDPQCHLRPASSLISKRHCAVLRRAGKAYLRDFDSTNGTFLNDEPVKGEVELSHGDRLRVGPLLFEVKLEIPASVERPTPVPGPAKVPADSTSDDDIAALLLGDDVGNDGPSSADVPEGSTVLDLQAVQQKEADAAKAAEPTKKEKADKASSDTRSAAEMILKKYMRRPRT